MITHQQQKRMIHFNQKQRVVFLNTLRFDILAGGDSKKKISDFDLLMAEEEQVDDAIRKAETII